MRPPFILRVEAAHPAAARALALALVPSLRSRGAQVRLDGVDEGGDGRFEADVRTAAQPGLAAPLVRIGVAVGAGVSWVRAIAVPSEPHAATREVLSFLERWGFTGSLAARPPSF